MIVVDASAVVELLLRSAAGEAISKRVLRKGETMHAPALLDVEVAHVLRRYVARKDMTAQRAKAALDLLVSFPMERYTHEQLLQRIWELRDNVSAYDAAYVALAEGLRAPLLTCDAKLAAAPGLRADMELVVA
ncbi:MAG: type II toxin-antitoxin system VapC family toxin [Gemmatimonadaceae bacterium]